MHQTRTAPVTAGGMIDTLGGDERDQNDQTRLRHGRHRHEGMATGIYHQPAPMLFTRDGHNIMLGDMYRGRSAFLICGGPSFKLIDQEKLRSRGIITIAVNNVATVFRPNLWTCVDTPANFVEQIWLDPAIIKLVPMDHFEKTLCVGAPNNKVIPSTIKVGDCPAVFGFRRNEMFRPEQWLYEDSFNWGSHSDAVDELGQKGSRSVMYIALRMLFYLGIRTTYIVGADFKMMPENEPSLGGNGNYAFAQARHSGSIHGNNSSYRIMNVRFQTLRPHFEKENYHVYNCTPGSSLTAFDQIDFNTAIENATAEIRATPVVTENRYDTEYLAKQEKQPNRKTPAVGAKPVDGGVPDPIEVARIKAAFAVATDEDRKIAKANLDKTRQELDAAKQVYETFKNKPNSEKQPIEQYREDLNKMYTILQQKRAAKNAAEKRKNDTICQMRIGDKWVKV